MKNKSKEIIVSLLFYTILVLSMWYLVKIFSDSVSSHEIISPEKNVKCVVVSRMFNTSVSCWKTENNFNRKTGE